jgi:hypothetical protein
MKFAISGIEKGHQELQDCVWANQNEEVPVARLNDIVLPREKLLDFVADPDPLLSMLEWLTSRLLRIEAEAKVGVEKGKHDESRTTHFSAFNYDDWTQSPGPGTSWSQAQARRARANADGPGSLSERGSDPKHRPSGTGPWNRGHPGESGRRLHQGARYPGRGIQEQAA